VLDPHGPFSNTVSTLAWVLIGSLALHIGIKLPIIARFWRKRADYGPGTDHLTDAVPVERVAGSEAERLWGSSRPTGLTDTLADWPDRRHD